ncbi:MAG: hypothetical protein R3E12_15100 [Candidatus Eisenbacteria bacterium]
MREIDRGPAPRRPDRAGKYGGTGRCPSAMRSRSTRSDGDIVASKLRALDQTQELHHVGIVLELAGHVARHGQDFVDGLPLGPVALTQDLGQLGDDSRETESWRGSAHIRGQLIETQRLFDLLDQRNGAERSFARFRPSRIDRPASIALFRLLTHQGTRL